MRQAGGIDSTFLALETHDHPLHVMAVMMLDSTTVPGGYSFEGLREFVADRLGGVRRFAKSWSRCRWGWDARVGSMSRST
jgi:diacylglycerol O-acyltransferase